MTDQYLVLCPASLSNYTKRERESGTLRTFPVENHDYQSDCSLALVTIVSAIVYKHTLVMRAELQSDW